MKRFQIQYLMKSRVLLLFIFFILAFIYLGYRLVFISVLDDNNYKQHVLSQQISNLTDTNNQIIPRRGTIYDTRGIAFAQSNVIYNVIYDPGVLKLKEPETVDKTIFTLSDTLVDVTAEQLRTLLETKPNSHYEIIARGLNYDEIKPIQDALNVYEIAGVAFEEQYERIYPYDSMASDVIGFLRSDGVGNMGIEKYYDSFLIGEVGRSFGTIDDEELINQEEVEAINGADVYLNIDFTVQSYVEEAILNFYAEEEALSVNAIVMDPRDGSILAMASYPNYDLNEPYNLDNLYSEETLAVMDDNEIADARNLLWRNGNVTDSYEPGSTFKPFTFAMAFEEYLVDMNTTYYCGGSKIPYEGEKPIHCHKLSGHGEQTILEALSNSCNVAMMDMAETIGKDFFYSYQRMFGFGAVTGIDTVGEQSHRNNVYTYEEMGPVELATSSFGQGGNVTPIQLITAFSSLINGGNLYQPQIMDRIIAEDGRLIKENEPVVLRKVLSEEVSDLVRDALRVVVDEGTGKRAQVEGYSVGGKTGTAEKKDRETKDYIVSFIGFSPVVEPEVITLVVVDDPVGEDVNSRYAAAIFKDIMEDVLPYLRVPREYEPESAEEIGE